jgi:hypothetical protein
MATPLFFFLLIGVRSKAALGCEGLVRHLIYNNVSAQKSGEATTTIRRIIE